MIKQRIIPLLLLKEERLVKGKQFSSYRDVGNPVSTAKIFNAQKADELILINIDASHIMHEGIQKIIKGLAEECFIPLTVGGGVRTLEEIETLLRIGADKVCINTKAVEDLNFIKQASDIFGDQCIVVSIDYKIDGENRWVYSNFGKNKTAVAAEEHIYECIKAGAGEILLTSIEHEGMMEGYDFDFLKKVSDKVAVPIIASGGAGKLQDLETALVECNVDAVSVGSMFFFTDQSPIKARTHLSNRGINVRRE